MVALIYSAIVLPKDSPTPSESFDFVGMLLLSPGLALFLYGASSTPETGTLLATKVLVPGLIGLALVAAFVLRSLLTRIEHPLIDLHLFRNRQLTIAVISMSLFAIAFFGAGLLFPSYFLQVRGETTLQAGILLAPQGLGAMITMPIAGILADRTGPGKIVLTGIAVIALGMAAFTQVAADTSYVLLLGSLFVMGLGMGATMMPIMTAALQTLTDHNLARGSTLMNIVQQVAGSIGTALMSVVLTNATMARDAAETLVEAGRAGRVDQLAPAAVGQGLSELADAFGLTFVVATVLIVACLVPACYLPRRKPPVALETERDTAAPLLMH
jgi:EmrB/QacA subfamily drug resistance transporter